MDALNGAPLLDHKLARGFECLAPYMGLSDLEKPRSFSGNQKFPVQVAAAIANWLRHG